VRESLKYVTLSDGEMWLVHLGARGDLGMYGADKGNMILRGRGRRSCLIGEEKE